MQLRPAAGSILSAPQTGRLSPLRTSEERFGQEEVHAKAHAILCQPSARLKSFEDVRQHVPLHAVARIPAKGVIAGVPRIAGPVLPAESLGNFVAPERDRASLARHEG